MKSNFCEAFVKSIIHRSNSGPKIHKRSNSGPKMHWSNSGPKIHRRSNSVLRYIGGVIVVQTYIGGEVIVVLRCIGVIFDL